MSAPPLRRVIATLALLSVSGLVLQGGVAQALTPELSDSASREALPGAGTEPGIAEPGIAEPEIAEPAIGQPNPDPGGELPPPEHADGELSTPSLPEPGALTEEPEAPKGGPGSDAALPEAEATGEPEASPDGGDPAPEAARNQLAVGAAPRSPGDEAAIFAAVNRARISYCQAIVRRDPAMDRVARNWSSYMEAKRIYHHNPKYTDQIPQPWISAGENIYAGPRTGQDAFDGWMRSPGHRENILNESYTDIGIGFVRGAYDATYTTQVFGGYMDHYGGKFLDVRPWSKFSREINWMGAKKLSTGNRVPGCGKTKVTYQPKEQVSREAMAAFLYRLDQAKYRGPAVSPFSDVQPGHKFYKEITWMHSRGLATGTRVPGKKPVFAPRESVSREAMAAFMYRFEEAKFSAPAASPFADMKRGDKFYREISWMHATKLSTGTKQPSGRPKYAPRERVTREAMAAFIYRAKR